MLRIHFGMYVSKLLTKPKRCGPSFLSVATTVVCQHQENLIMASLSKHKSTRVFEPFSFSNLLTFPLFLSGFSLPHLVLLCLSPVVLLLLCTHIHTDTRMHWHAYASRPAYLSVSDYKAPGKLQQRRHY